MRKAAFLFVAVLAIRPPLNAQSPQQSSGEPPDLSSYTCAEHLRLVDLQDGRSDIITLWAHGYYSGMRGVDQKSGPIAWTSVQQFSKHVVADCREAPGRLFIKAVKQLAQGKSKNPNP